MKWLLLSCAFLLGCDDEALYADGSAWSNSMPLSPGRIAPRAMDDRQWATFVAQAGIQADKDVRSFTPTWTGFSAAPSGDISYYDFEKIVVLYWDGATELVGTSNAFTMTITNLPDRVTPLNAKWLPCLVVNNDFTVHGSVSISTSGVLTFYFGQVTPIIGAIEGIAFQASGFNNANNKGVPAGWLIQYTK